MGYSFRPTELNVEPDRHPSESTRVKTRKMVSKKSQTLTPLSDRPFPDENTVSEMYCNEAFTVDNEAVEDWSSSLQMLQTFAAIFSAVLITLIVDSKSLLQQDTNEAIFDAMVFLMNDLANGTHRPYVPPKFQPSTQSILVNCFFFASLCLSIGTALAAVLAMQWVTDYGAVTRRAGSTPEERVKRRHFRYQGGQDWKMDGIIGALPIALHVSVVLFFVGLIIWMWDVHHSVFAVVIVCGAVAALFYLLTTILAIFYPSCPYRTPLASWTYILLHLLVRVIFPSSWLAPQQRLSDGDVEKEGATHPEDGSRFQRSMRSLLSRLASSSLDSRDDTHIRSSDKRLMVGPLVWLSNQIPISPEIYRRLLVFVDGFSSIVDPEAHRSVVPWMEIFRALGTAYRSFVETLGLSEDEFTEFAQRTHCLSQPGMKEILEFFSSSSEEVDVNDSIFPVQLLRSWKKSTSLHTSDMLRKQRYSDEIVLQALINDVSPTSQVLLKTWYGLLEDEVKAVERLLPELLLELGSGSEERKKQRLDTISFLVATGNLPWQATVPYGNMSFPSNALLRRIRLGIWVTGLRNHPQKGLILWHLSGFGISYRMAVILTEDKFKEEEKAELKRMGVPRMAIEMCIENKLEAALNVFNLLIKETEDQETRRDLTEWVVTAICGDLRVFYGTFDPKHFHGWYTEYLLQLSNPILRLIACATLGFEWKEEWSPGLLEAKDLLGDQGWYYVSDICFTDSILFDGDCTSLWQLRLRLWIHFSPGVTGIYLNNVIQSLNTVKPIEQGFSSTGLGIERASDFLLALFHLNYTYNFDSPRDSLILSFIPDIVVGNTASSDIASTEVVDYLSTISVELKTDPTRLIRLLIELVRADINHEPQYRRPQILQNLLKHAEANLSGKELRPFSPSCRRLARYIRVSYQQFEETWDEVLNRDYDDFDPRPHYAQVDRGEMKAVYERMVTLLESIGAWDGEVRDVSWPRDLLRPTGTKEKPFEEVEQGEAKLNEEQNGDNDDHGDDEGDDNEEEHEDQAKRRLDDQLPVNSKSSLEGKPAVIEGPVE